MARKKETENLNFWLAASDGNLETVQSLFEKHPIDINYKTPLIVAAENQKKEVVQFLLSKGADKTLLDKNAKTAFEVTKNHEIKQLLDPSWVPSSTTNNTSQLDIKSVEIIKKEMSEQLKKEKEKFEQELKKEMAEQIKKEKEKVEEERKKNQEKLEEEKKEHQKKVEDERKKIEEQNKSLQEAMSKLNEEQEKLKNKGPSSFRELEIDPSQISFDRNKDKIGEGACAVVYRGTIWSTHLVALKELKIQSDQYTSRVMKNFQKEVDVMRRLKHPNIIVLYGICSKDKNAKPIIVQEYLQRGSLYSILHANTLKSPLPLHKQIKLAIGIANDNDWNAKITDFGLAKVKDETLTLSTAPGSTAPLGTPQWMAPEVLISSSFSEKSDIYSYGMILYELATNLIPFFNKQTLAAITSAISKNETPILPNDYDPNLKQMVQACWDAIPANRPSFNSILQTLESCSEKEDIQKNFLGSEYEFPPDLIATGWTQNEQHLQLELNQNPKSNDPAYLQFQILEELFKKLHASEKFTISRAFAIENPALSAGFKSRITIVRNRILKDPNIFKPTEHLASEPAWRQWMLEILTKYTSRFPNQIHEEIQIIPVFHAVKEEKIAWKICSNGFANLSSKDAGWFGKGVYFTSSLDYGTSYYGEPNSNGEYVVLLNEILLGSVYPVVEDPNDLKNGLKGKPCKSGYNTHFTIVKPPSCTPCPKNSNDSNKNYTEFVLFEESQCLPKYVLFVKRKPNF